MKVRPIAVAAVATEGDDLALLDPVAGSLPPVPSPDGLPGVMSMRGAGWPESFARLRETYERPRLAARHDSQEDDYLTNPHTIGRASVRALFKALATEPQHRFPRLS